MENQTRKHGAISEQESALTVRGVVLIRHQQENRKPNPNREETRGAKENLEAKSRECGQGCRGQRGPKRKTPHGALTAGFYSLCSCLSPEHHRSSEMQEQGIKSSLYSTVSPGLEHCLAVRELNQCDLLKEAVHHDWGRWGAPQEVHVAVEETPFVGA